MKLVLYNEFTTVDIHELSRTEAFIVDCDYLMYTVQKNKDICKTYHEVFMQ